MQARQIQNTPERPYGQGHIADISQEEYDKRPGAFRWIADEVAAELAEREKSARAERERQDRANAEARQALRHDLAERIKSARANARNLGLKRDEISKQIKALEDMADDLQKRLDGLSEHSASPAPKPAEPAKPDESPRPAIDLRNGVRKIRG